MIAVTAKCVKWIARWLFPPFSFKSKNRRRNSDTFAPCPRYRYKPLLNGKLKRGEHICFWHVLCSSFWGYLLVFVWALCYCAFGLWRTIRPGRGFCSLAVTLPPRRPSPLLRALRWWRETCFKITYLKVCLPIQRSLRGTTETNRMDKPSSQAKK